MTAGGKDGELDHMVLTYLQERGFTESAAKLRDEAQVRAAHERASRRAVARRADPRAGQGHARARSARRCRRCPR